MTALLRKAVVAAALAVLTTSCLRYQAVRTDVAPDQTLGTVLVHLTSGGSVYLGKAAISGDSIVGRVAGYSRPDRDAGLDRRAFPLKDVAGVESTKINWIKTILLVGPILLILGIIVIGIGYASFDPNPI